MSSATHGPRRHAGTRSRAARSRRSVSSRPSTSSDSNSGGPTVRPVTATRTGAWASLSLAPSVVGDRPPRLLQRVSGPRRRRRSASITRSSSSPAHAGAIALAHAALVDDRLVDEQEVDHRRGLGQRDHPRLQQRRHAPRTRRGPSRRGSTARRPRRTRRPSIARMYSPLKAASFLRSKNAGEWVTSSSRNSSSICAHGTISVSPRGAQPSVIR